MSWFGMGFIPAHGNGAVRYDAYTLILQNDCVQSLCPSVPFSLSHEWLRHHIRL